MSIQKISFTSSLLDKNINKSAKISVTKPDVQTTTEDMPPEQNINADSENKNHKVRNWSIGLGSAAVLIGLGVAGRKGKLGKGIQKMLGGLKEIKDINIAEINAKLDRSIPELSEDLFKFKNTDFLNFSDLRQVRAAEVVEDGDKLIQTHLLPGNYKQVLVADKATKKYKLYFVTDASNKTLWFGGLDESGELKNIFSGDDIFSVTFTKVKQIKVVDCIKRRLDENSYLVYDSSFNLKYQAFKNGNIQKTILYLPDDEGKFVPKYAFYKNIEKNIRIKDEVLANNSKDIILENYYDDAGNLAKTVSNL